MLLNVRVTSEGIIYDENTQKALGFIGQTEPPQDIAWADRSELNQVLAACRTMHVAVTIRTNCPTCGHV